MAEAADVTKLERGEFLFHQGDPSGTLHIIRKGRVDVLATSIDGHELVFRSLDPGAVIGELSLFEDVPRSASIRATLHSTLIQLSGPDIITIAHDHPDLGIALARIAARRARLLSAYVEHTAFAALSDRLRSLLATLAQDGPGGTAYVRTTQASLGQQLGVTREAVNRHLQQLKSSGHISIERGRIIVGEPGFLD